MNKLSLFGISGSLILFICSIFFVILNFEIFNKNSSLYITTLVSLLQYPIFIIYLFIDLKKIPSLDIYLNFLFNCCIFFSIICVNILWTNTQIVSWCLSEVLNNDKSTYLKDDFKQFYYFLIISSVIQIFWMFYLSNFSGNNFEENNIQVNNEPKKIIRNVDYILLLLFASSFLLLEVIIFIVSTGLFTNLFYAYNYVVWLCIMEFPVLIFVISYYMYKKTEIDLNDKKIILSSAFILLSEIIYLSMSLIGQNCILPETGTKIINKNLLFYLNSVLMTILNFILMINYFWLIRFKKLKIKNISD